MKVILYLKKFEKILVLVGSFLIKSQTPKKPNEGLKLDSLLTWCVNSDPKIAKELDVVSDTDIVMLDGRNHEAFVNESITNSATSEQRTVCLIGDGTPEPEITGKPWSMTNFAPSWEINEHVENKKRFTEDVKKDVMPTVERYEEHQSKGESVKQEAFTNEDAKDVTPSSGWRSPIEMERTDLIEIPASGCASFTVCILDDVQPSLVAISLASIV
ncbi:hypothetical protein HPP92_021412 [Vanilla planifolia]|uniref:Uncharacterized protein n=1 Tax=Vanilla planifolia TaxID=51239 RepID=A0A835PYS9_VANPL|nr:hypothetical protein HPP92_021412 [Vanilla planifolia]